MARDKYTLFSSTQVYTKSKAVWLEDSIVCSGTRGEFSVFSREKPERGECYTLQKRFNFLRR